MLNLLQQYLRQRSPVTSVGRGKAAYGDATPNNRPLINATALEARILYSALPLGDMADTTTEPLADVPTLEACPSGDVCQTVDAQSEEAPVAGDSESVEPIETDLTKTVIFVDQAVPDYKSLIDDIVASAEPDTSLQIFLLDGERDGIEQVTEILSALSDVDQVHFFSHGSSGEVQLGSTTLSSSSLGGYASDLYQWSSALSADADILFYGCDLASGNGELLVESISELTGADVAASDDATGHTDRGGDWTLELHVGLIEADVVVSQQFQEQWQNILATYTVTNTNDTGAGSLRQAITDANNNSGADTIEFNISAPLTGGAHVITVNTNLPQITDTVTIDGTTDSDYSGSPVIQVASGTATADRGFYFGTGSQNSTLRGLSIVDFGYAGVRIQGGSATGTTIVGNYIGLDVDGTTAMANNYGIFAFEANTTIGGSTAADRNVISGNTQDGIFLNSSDATGIVITGNYIGTNAAGTAAVGNGADGIVLFGSSGVTGNRIGGHLPGEGNVISGNTDGIKLEGSGVTGNEIYGNYIGTDATGSFAVANTDDGIQATDGANNNQIGDGGSGYGNVIAGNDDDGVQIGASSDANVIQGNRIGVSADGTSAIGNGDVAISVSEADNILIGGPNSADGNWIGPARLGVYITGADGTIVQHNRIGTDLSGTANWGVDDSSIRISGWAGAPTGTQILDNIIAYSGQSGATSNNSGITINSTGGAGQTFLRNVIYSSHGLAIDLGDDGLSTNDSGDGDTGPNDLQNFPVLSNVSSNGTDTSITGTLNSSASTTYRIEFFSSPTADSSGHGEAAVYLGFTTVTTNGSGNASFSEVLTGVTVAGGHVVSATATVDLGGGDYGSTSELSSNIYASDGILTVDTSSDVSDGDTSSIGALIANKGADGFISLREAIVAANNTANYNASTADNIEFNIAGGGIHTIAVVGSSLPQITGMIVIDGTTQHSFTTAPRIQVDGGGTQVEGLRLFGGSGGSTIRGLSITNFTYTGITVSGSSGGSTIAGNYIGIGADGSTTGGNQYGVRVFDQDITIGGTSAADRNVISGNTLSGIEFTSSDTSGGLVVGNYIGTDSTGNVAAGNHWGMSLINGAQNITIGGSTAADRNIISANTSNGIHILDATTNNLTIQGNWIGMGADGSTAIGNAGDGIFVANASDVTIGGDSAGEGNWIVRSGESGIDINGGAQRTIVQGNTIGTDAGGTVDLGNDSRGVYMTDGVDDSLVGGTTAGAGNVIAFNANQGIFLEPTTGTGNSILGNEIYSNGLMGIDFDTIGPNVNDSGDADSGANDLQNTPVITSAVTDGSSTTVAGTLNSTASQTFRIEFFSSPTAHASGHGDAAAFLGFVLVTTNGSGNASFSTSLAAVPAGHQVTATATRMAGADPQSTSEFAANVVVNQPASGTPTVTGTPTENQTLTADTSGISDANGIASYTYQWTRDGVDIAGATASTYTLGDADVGTQIAVRVSLTDDDGYSEGPLTSSSVGPIANVNDAPSGLPTISGTATEDETLTADTSGISDDDGLGTFSYQWQRDGVDLSGATSATYTLGDSDVGSNIRVVVDYTDGNGTAESLTSAATSAVTNINDAPSGVPAVSGTTTEDQTLTADTSGISDDDGLGSFSYQWLRDGVSISGATASTYTLGDADVGTQISVQVSYTDGQGTAEGPLTSAQTSAITNVNDPPSGVPTITGTPTEDETLTADTSGISDADGLGAFNYQWQRDGSNIAGATGSTYTLGDADVGSNIRVIVSYTDGNGTAESVTSAATSAVTNINDAPSGVPTITGTATEDETLTADTSGISDNDGLGTFSYQWQRDGTNIAGATGSTYTLGDDDVDSNIRVIVSYTDGNGTAESVTSAATSAVTNINDAPSGVPAISGTTSENETLTADTSGISDNDGLGTLSYQWLRDGVAIGGATASTYTLTNTDVGTQISVQVSYTDGQGTAEGPLTSSQTSAITNVNDPPSGVPTITGTATEDETLTADTSGISDADGLGTFNYQWQRDGVDIGGATSSTYTLGDDDVGSNIRIIVSYTDGNGTNESVTSAETSAVTNINDAPTGVPTITGTATEDETLTADTSGISDNDGLGTFSYQWLRDGVAISGATASTYTLGDADVGTQISVQVSYTDAHGTAEGPLTSAQTAAVTNVNDSPSGVPTITGTFTEDETLTADTSGISDADGLGTFSYQWQRDGVDIGGATGSTYTLDDADVGSNVRVIVSYTDGNGTAESVTSAATSAVTNVNDAPSGVPTISGSTSENETLTADTSGISDNDGLGAFSYQWLRDGVAISGATGTTYTLSNTDVGTQISVQVSYTDGNGTAEGPLTSAQTSAITNVNDPPTGVPTITGTAAEDETLTADTSGISDADGLGTFSYQWQRDGVDIGGATGSTYTLGDADVGSNVRVIVSYTDGNGTAESVTSAATSAVTNVNDAPSGAPTITGTATEDETLTADTSGISDGDGLGTFSYQWRRDGVDIGGATGSTYTLGDADVGSNIRVVVSYTDGNGTAESVTSAATTAVTNINDAPAGVPTISGSTFENETLTADTSGISDNDGLGSFSYQWLRDGVAIGGATASTYTLTNTDVGTQISVQVSYTDGQGTAEGPLTSSQTSAITNVNDPPSGVPTITGTATEDETLTADTSGISDADGLGTFNYQWQRDGSNIAGATGSTYTLGDDDVGSNIRVIVSYTDGNGTSESVTSAATSAVTNVNDAPSGLPTITGTAAEDETLTADTSGISDADGLGTFNYQWQRDGSNIAGATGSTYTLGDDDVGSNIRVVVSYTDGNGTNESVTSAATSAVTNVNDAPSGIPTITGTATEDETLTADTSGISDNDGLGTFSYQWQRDGVDIGGATGSTYTLGDADVGSNIRVIVSYTDGNGTSESVTSAATSAVTNVNDAPSGVPTISGSTSENETLTADTSGISDADGLGAFSYQWLRDGVAIGGATGTTYTLSNADVGTQISVQVSYTDGNGTAEGPLTSAQTSAITNVNDPPSGAPTITGSATEDETLTADTSGISDADGLGTFNYQWQRDGVDITGATNSTYTLGDSDVGSNIRVIASYTDGNGTAESVTSAATSAVTNINDAPSGSPTIVGSAEEDAMLTVDTSSIADGDGVGTYSYQWLRDGSPIPGATSSNYSLGDDDVGSQISVQVSYTDGQGTWEGPLVSSATPVVGNVNDAPQGAIRIGPAPWNSDLLIVDTDDFADADGLGTLSYQWTLDGTPISGANDSTLSLVGIPGGAEVGLLVSYTDGQGTAEGPISSSTIIRPIVGRAPEVNEAQPPEPTADSEATRDEEGDMQMPESAGLPPETNTLAYQQNPFADVESYRIPATVDRPIETQAGFAPNETNFATNESDPTLRIARRYGLQASRVASSDLAVMTPGIHQPLSLFASDVMLATALDEFQTSVEAEEQQLELVSGVASGVFLVATAATALWMLSATSFVSMLSTSLPAWASFDPIFILQGQAAGAEESDASIADLIAAGNTSADGERS